jgi:DNA-directed RNA polymerase subunit RPC12/RpoP
VFISEVIAMVGEILCPDCGGVVGATQASEVGEPCRCFAEKPRQKADESTEPPPVELPRPKICVLCGADVDGKKRVKDSRGYTCYECAKAEEKRELGGRVRCRVCGHLVKETSLAEYEGTKMCSKCYSERTALKKQRIKQIGFTGARSRFEFSQVYQLLAIMGVLALIIVVGMLFHGMGRHH